MLIWNISTKAVSQAPVAPYALLTEGSEHECPLPVGNQDPIKVVFKEGVPYSNQVLCDFNKVWFVDGNCSYFEGCSQMGYAAV